MSNKQTGIAPFLNAIKPSRRPAQGTIEEIFEGFDDMFGSLFGSYPTCVPSPGIRKTDGGYQIEIPAPGLKKTDFEIRLDGENLLARAKLESRENLRTYQRSFSYSWRVGSIDPKQIIASYEDGVLRIDIPVARETIEVNAKIEVK